MNINDKVLQMQINEFARAARKAVGGDVAIVVVSTREPDEKDTKSTVLGVSGAGSMRKSELSLEVLTSMLSTAQVFVQQMSGGNLELKAQLMLPDGTRIPMDRITKPNVETWAANG